MKARHTLEEADKKPLSHREGKEGFNGSSTAGRMNSRKTILLPIPSEDELDATVWVLTRRQEVMCRDYTIRVQILD